MTTAAAPACWPKIALATRAQVPRFATAIWPSPAATPLNAYAAGEQPSDSSAEPRKPASSVVVAGLSCSTTIGPVSEGPKSKPFALIRVNGEPFGPAMAGVVVSVAPGVVCHTSCAAV